MISPVSRSQVWCTLFSRSRSWRIARPKMLGARLMFNGLMYMRESTYIKVYTYTYTYYTYTYTYIYILFMVFCIIYLEICYACIYNCLFRIVMHSCHVFFWYWFWFFKFVSVGLCTIPCEVMSICKHIVIYIYIHTLYCLIAFYIFTYAYTYIYILYTLHMITYWP